jgi:Cu+-exporting ATPase
MSGIELDIDGMTCAGCASRVEKALAGVAGVSAARVNLALERARVEGDVASEDLVDAVARAGYAAWRHDDVDPEARAARDRAEDRQAWLWLSVAVLLTLPFMIQMGLMMSGLGTFLPVWLEPVVAAPVVFGAGARFFVGAWHAVKTRTGTMDVLVALGTGAAYFYSLALAVTQGAAVEGHLYFEAAAVIITLVLLGKRLEARAKAGTTAAIRGLMALAPETARRIADGGREEVVPISRVALGDRILVRPGERIPVDGTVVDGVSDVDESLVTGESVPAAKSSGGDVVGGALNIDGLLTIEATAVGKDGTLARIVRLVERAQGGKAPVQKLVDRVSAVFVPIVLGLAGVTFAGWLIAGQGIEPALIAAVSVLVIACPCALGLATPTAIVAGTGAAARAGILIKDVEALERAARIDTVLFDKTGTLTEGRPKLARAVACPGEDADALVRLAAVLQRGGDHPLAGAFHDRAPSDSAPPEGFRNHPGEGVSGRVGVLDLAIGNRAILGRLGLSVPDWASPDTVEAEGETVSFLIRDGDVVALFGFLDTPRPESAAAVARLRADGRSVAMISGDGEAVARRIAARLGIDDVAAEVRPDMKAGVVRARQKSGDKVAMVGDGINDAPALVQADLGIAMGGGAEIALDAAPVTLMRPDPSLVPATLDICRRTVAKIRHNLFWAFIYNVIGLPLAALGYLSPGVAGAAMALSSVSVVTSSLMLRRWRP